MQNAITSIFCHVDDFLKAIFWKDDSQCRMDLAEVVTTGLVSWWFFHGNLELSRVFLIEHGYIPNMLSKSRLNRRLHAIPSFFWHLIVSHLSQLTHSSSRGFLVDSFPVFVCHNIRSKRRSLLKGKKFIGYNASKQSWFTGLKVHMLTTFQGNPKEFLFSPASTHDLTAFRQMYLGSIPNNSIIIGDKAYISAEFEAKLAKEGLHLITDRKVNSRRGQSLIYHRYGRKIRKRIETTFSKISSWLPRSIHAVTDKGFVLKLMLLIAAFSMTFLDF